MFDFRKAYLLKISKLFVLKSTKIQQQENFFGLYTSDKEKLFLTNLSFFFF